MEQTILQIAVQVPALFIMGAVFLKVLGMVLDVQGKKLDRLADAIERRNAGP
jgi:hypothetical protein